MDFNAFKADFNLQRIRTFNIISTYIVLNKKYLYECIVFGQAHTRMLTMLASGYTLSAIRLQLGSASDDIKSKVPEIYVPSFSAKMKEFIFPETFIIRIYESKFSKFRRIFAF